MSEILFRGKRIDNGEWVEGSLINNGGGRMFIAVHPSLAFGPTCKDEINGETLWGFYPFFEVNPSTVGQDTGLPDKNGKKIFMGDIAVFSTGTTAEVKYGAFSDDEEGYYGYGWYFQTKDEWRSGFAGAEHDQKYGCSVIGNVYDNPELLRGE